MTPRELPEYLRPVPGPGEGSTDAMGAAEAPQPAEPAAPEPPAPETPASESDPLEPQPPEPVRAEPDSPEPPSAEPSADEAERSRPDPRTNGLIAPTRRGHSGGFVTDAIVDLGFA